MSDRQELAILRSVVYASLFDYPLTLDQLHESLVSSTLTTDQIASLYEGSAFLRSVVDRRDGFFFPAGRSDLLTARAHREARSREFLDAHRGALRLICAIPYTRMIALSGSVAHLNLDDGGDLDLFVITRGHRVWMVTVAAIVLTRLLGVRRVACVNFVMSDTQLTLEQQDLFTANQVLHLKPLIGAEVLEGFVAANPFVRRFYPNRRGAHGEHLIEMSRPLARVKGALELLLRPAAPALEALCRRAYAWHLHRRSRSWQSPDQVRLQRDSLKLHTQSHRRSVLQRFDEELDRALRQVHRGDHAAIA